MDELVNKLIEERARLWEQMKEVLDRETEEERTLDAAEREQVEKINTRIGELDARIQELVELEEANQAADEARQRYEHVVRSRRIEPTSSPDGDLLTRFLRGEVRSFEVSLRDVDRRVDPHSGAWEVRDLIKDTAAAGGDTVPTSFRRLLYEHLVENSAIRQTNATILVTDSGENLEIPKTVTHGTAAQVGEGTALAENDPTFGKVTLGAWKYGQLLQVSNELITDTGVNLLDYIARDTGRALGNASGADFITGNGTNKPLGVMTAAGTGVNGGTGVSGVPTADELIDLYYSVIEPYARNGFWLMRRATEGTVRKIKDTTNQYLWQPGLQSGIPNMILGRPVVTDPNVAATGTNNLSVAFGDFRSYFIRDVAGVRFERSDDFAFSSDLVSFRAILRTDGDLVDLTGAVKVYAGGTA